MDIPSDGAAPAPQQPDDECALCDKVLAAGGIVIGLVILFMGADLLTGGAITARLFGSRRDPGVWDVPDPAGSEAAPAPEAAPDA